MLKKLLPKQDSFFNLFQEAAHQLVGAAEQFHAMLLDLAHADHYAKIIANHEAIGDNIARSTYDLLHKTFITPFDRHDLNQLTGQLDDILDLINRTAKRISVYKVTVLPDEITKLAKLGIQATTSLRDTLKQLENLKNSPTILKNCLQVNEAESRADAIKMAAVAKLFADEENFKVLLINKEILDYSKSIISECHHLANIIKGIVLEYS